MKERNSTRWAGVCSGGYLAAAATYAGNALAMALVRGGKLWPALSLAALKAASATMGCLVLSEKVWARKAAVVMAAGILAIHLDGLAYLFLADTPSDSTLARSMQWQLGFGLSFLWLGILGSALWMAKRPAATLPLTPP